MVVGAKRWIAVLAVAGVGGCGAGHDGRPSPGIDDEGAISQTPMSGAATLQFPDDEPASQRLSGIADDGTADGTVNVFVATDDGGSSGVRIVAADPAAFDSLLLDPFILSMFDSTDLPKLLALLLDDLALGLVSPLPSGAGLTFLERLCRQGDEPDFRCRQRFGE